MPTLYELKQSLGMIGQQLANKNEELSKSASNPNVKIEDIEKLKKEKEGLQNRYEIVEQQVKEMEVKQQSKLDDSVTAYNKLSKEEQIIKAKAEFYRHAILPSEFAAPSKEAQKLLHVLPTGNDSGGDKFLPTTLSNEVVAEPFTKNKLREKARLTNIKGLELPRIAYSLDDDDFVTGKETAKELKLKGDTVKFGSHKFKVIATLSDTIIHGSDVDLVNFVENALQSGLAAKERKDAFATSPKQGLEHMTFYQNVKSINGKTVYEAITNALADLHEDFRENATIYMKYTDFVSMIDTLSNKSNTLYEAQPELVFGKPIIFTDVAVKPVVGDYNYFGINYDATTYDTDKDVRNGEYLFVLTAWYDQQRTLDSAFRVANVSASATSSTPK